MVDPGLSPQGIKVDINVDTSPHMWVFMFFSVLIFCVKERTIAKCMRPFWGKKMLYLTFKRMYSLTEMCARE